MPIEQNFVVQIDHEEILRLLGYEDEAIEQEILDEVYEEIEKIKTFIHPQVIYQQLNIEYIVENKVFLNNGSILRGEYMGNKLKNCQYIVMAVSSLGKEVEAQVNQSFQTGEYLKGMIQDHVGTVALEYINKLFWQQLIEGIQESTIGITKRFSPGDHGWNISDQKAIFSSLNPENVGITLSESYMMVPMKSTSMIYGFGEGIGIERFGHICRECTMKGCEYRMSKRIKLTVHQDSTVKILKVDPGENLLEILRTHDLFIDSPCNGKGTCGKCKVLCIKGIPNPTDVDKKHLSKLELEKGYRLACQITLDHSIEIGMSNYFDSMEILSDRMNLHLSGESVVVKRYMELEVPSMEDQRSNHQRIKDYFTQKDIFIPVEILKSLPDSMREAGYKITATCYKNQIIHVEQGDKSTQCYGLAVDIGTTTVVMYLMDLNTGKTIDVVSRMNKQKSYGADVISRIQYTIDHKDGLLILQQCIIEQLNDMIEILCRENRVQPNHLYYMTVAANTTMVHLFLGLSPENIAKAPYIPVTTDEMEIWGKELGLKINGFVAVLPGISSYVGGDISAGILACELFQKDQYSLLLDLGTNGEIVIGNKNEIITCSTAAGPAFEGANIKWGIGGIKGAISKIDFSSEKIYETIGQEKPCGICGSGVLDMVAELKNYHLIDETGRILDLEEIQESKRWKEQIKNQEDMRIFFIAKNPEGEEIVFTQKDIREVQMAKAAIGAGIQMLLKEKGIDKADKIDKIYIAGGFGNFMNIKSAIDIGLIPKEFTNKIESIGNAAGMGAKLCLISQDYRNELKAIVQKSTYIELSSRVDFQEYFIEGMYI